MNDNIKFNNRVSIELVGNGSKLSENHNEQTLGNRNILIDLYDGTNPSDPLDLALIVYYIDADTAGAFDTENITSDDDSTTEPSGSTVEAWGYEKTLVEFSSGDIGVRGGALTIRGRMYFPKEANIIRIDCFDVETGTVLFNSEQNGTVPTGRSALITYRITL